MPKAQDHHPNWYNVYGTVQIRLSSHDADGVTERDFRLASSIDQSLTEFDYIDLTPTPGFIG
jgi:4a-hydroxytetrahydrobiopterin dehydratase